MSYVVQLEIDVEDMDRAVHVRKAASEAILDLTLKNDGTLSSRIVSDKPIKNKSPCMLRRLLNWIDKKTAVQQLKYADDQFVRAFSCGDFERAARLKKIIDDLEFKL